MNLAAIIDSHPSDATALVSRGRSTTYGELREHVAGLRAGLAGLGLEPGDRLAVLAGNNWYFVASYLAALGAGLVVVPLNPGSPARELERELDSVGVRAIVVGPTGRSSFASIDRARVPTLEHVIVTEGVECEGAVLLDELVSSDPMPMIERSEHDVAVLMFTSGTAGFPKAAMLSHGNLLANIDQAQRAEGRHQTSDDVTLGVLPLFHIFGLNVVLGLSLAAGSSVVLVERFDPSSCLETVTNHSITIIPGAPTMWAAWAALPDVAADAFASVRFAASGAARLAPEVAQTIERRFGVTISEGYGLTEASPIVTSSSGVRTSFGSIGVPLPGVHVRLVDLDDDDVLVGDAGEVWVQGPNVFKGYWDDPEATASALTGDGWLRTGDVAVVDDAGHLFLVDRAKDLIIVSGFNVFPAEVEEVLLEMPGVTAAAVVGVAHPHTGEAVKAYVVVEPGRAFEEDDIIAFCANNLAKYKCPDKVMFVDELPTNPGGKIVRRALR
ncbi:MAG: AMP-binding protein [Acidimicrobiales bacterium]